MQMEARMAGRTRECVVGGRLVAFEKILHHPIFGLIRQSGEARDDAVRLQKTDRVNGGQLLAADKDMHLPRAQRQRMLRIVEGRRAAAQYRDPPARQRIEIDGLRGVGIKMAGQLRHHGGHLPLAAALYAGGHDDLARQQRFAIGQRQAEQAAPHRFHQRDPAVVAHRQAQHAAIPAQIVHPVAPGDLVNGGPALRPVHRLPISAEGERGDAIVDGGQMLGRAQRHHPRIAVPRPFLPRRIFVEHKDVGNPFAQQAEGRAQPALPAADDHHVVDVLVIWRIGAGPVRPAKAETVQIMRQPGLMLCQCHARSSRRRATILPISARAVAISLCSSWASRCPMAANMPALFVSRTQMMKGKPKRAP